jgi:hypothetical protein
MDEIYQRASAFLFGRRTYEIFAGSWGTWDDPGDSPIWTALHTRPKYPDTGPDRALDLVDSQATPKGVTIQVYRPSRRPQHATATPGLST